jgi:hypothetical protein
MSGTNVKEYHSETYKSEETKEEIIWLKQKFIWKTNGIVLRNQHKLQLSLIRVYYYGNNFHTFRVYKSRSLLNWKL